MKTGKNKQLLLKIPLILLGVVVLFSFGVNAAAAADQSQIYVSTQGNNSWDGQSATWNGDISGPKATITNATGTVATNGTVYIANGTYYESGININTNMTVIGENQQNTIINGTNSGNSIFLIASGLNVTISNLTLTQGQSNDGGAIYNNGTLTVTNGTFNNNNATGLGGAICNRYGNVTLTSNIFNNNIAQLGGGAICNYEGNLTVTNSILNNNTANLTGGAIMNFGTLTVTNNTFNNNTAQTDCGGAICNGDGNLTVTGNTFNNNTAQNGGGAIYIAEGNLTVTNNTFNNNTAQNGGAIYSYGTLNVTTSKFNNNTAENGGAIFNCGGINVTSSTFNNNTATDTTAIYGSGGAIWNYGGDSTSRVVNFNWIVGNSPNNSEIYSTNGTIDATLNWWGSNVDPSGFVAGNVTVTPWLVLNVTVDPITILNGGNSTVTVDLQHDSNGTYHDPNEGHLPDGIPVTFTGTLGNLNQTSTTLLNGQATSLFTAKSAVTAKASITATIDNYSASTPITVNSRSPPTVTLVDPANGAVNVAINKVIKVTFNESIIKGTGWIELVTSNGAVVPNTWSISGNVLTVNANNTLTHGIKYMVLIHTGSVTDLAGNIVAGYVSRFTTSTDVTVPAVRSVDPVNNAVNVAANKVIKVTFTETIKTGTNWIELVNSNGTIVPSTWSISGNVLTLNANNTLSKGVKYLLLIHTGSVTDSAGNNVKGYVSRFTVDTVAPTVKSVDPANNAVNVAVNKVIKVTFTETIKTGTSWIELVNSNGTVVPSTWSISGNTLAVTPNSTLTKGTKYLLLVHTGSVMDLAGNNLAGYVSRFSTVSQSTSIILGSTSYGYVEKEVYGNQSSNQTVVIIVGVHPMESGMHTAVFNALTSKSSNLSKRYVIYRVHVTKDASDYSKGRMNGQLLAQQFVVPDVSSENPMLVVDVHENHYTSSGYAYCRFLYPISRDYKTLSYAKKITGAMSFLSIYNPPNPTSTQYVTVPIANKGIPTLIYETYAYDSLTKKASDASAFINALDRL